MMRLRVSAINFLTIIFYFIMRLRVSAIKFFDNHFSLLSMRLRVSAINVFYNNFICSFLLLWLIDWLADFIQSINVPCDHWKKDLTHPTKGALQKFLPSVEHPSNNCKAHILLDIKLGAVVGFKKNECLCVCTVSVLCVCVCVYRCIVLLHIVPDQWHESLCLAQQDCWGGGGGGWG